MIIKQKKCKNCQVKFTPVRSSLETCCSLNCAIDLVNGKLLIKGTAAFKAAKIQVKSGDLRNELQRKINLLSRKIDAKHGNNTCIDCGKPFGKQIDAAHFHDLSTNRGLRFNLHNLHSAKSDCNQFSSKHKEGYLIGLEQRYGNGYKIFVKELEYEYTSISLNAIELKEKLKIVNKLIRDIETYKSTSAVHERTIFNNIIGIY